MKSEGSRDIFIMSPTCPYYARKEQKARMSLFVLSDPHLSLGNTGKSMEAFGPRWQNYIQRIAANWRAVVEPEDTVVLPGDISWAMTLSEATDDFAFLHALPGIKLIGKGNHDFFWNTTAKMERFFREHGWTSLRILYNNAFLVDNIIVCGTRGWFNDEKLQNTTGPVDYAKIINREVIRLRLTLDAAVAIRRAQPTPEALEIIPFLHFPPVWSEFRCPEILDVLHEYPVKRCYFGHIHGAYTTPISFLADGIRFVLCAADALRFTPLAIG